MKCYDCDTEFQAEAPKEMLDHLYDHYMKDHKAVITNADESEKKRWMQQFEKDWMATELL